ncbi:MAG: T9SS type A sorting domain-containing protein, partial [Flavobacteriales bacterium]|nr:T9SS type A sorting domain-containing protein [Flavobacteriales bacterium]
WAIPKSLDTDGSVVGGENNDGGSEGVAGGLLVNQFCPEILAPFLVEKDGLVAAEAVSTVTTVGIDLSVFGNENVGGLFTTNNGAWSVLEGVQGITSDNMVLIAQLTTDGALSFEINLQVGAPGGETYQYVASAPEAGQIQCDKLMYSEVFGCTDNTATNFNPAATIDDCSCTTDIKESVLPALNIFPNPANGVLNITVPAGFESNPQVSIWDATGKLVSLNAAFAQSQGIVTLDISSLAAGLYTVNLNSGGHSLMGRVVVE